MEVIAYCAISGIRDLVVGIWVLGVLASGSNSMLRTRNVSVVRTFDLLGCGWWLVVGCWLAVGLMQTGHGMGKVAGPDHTRQDSVHQQHRMQRERERERELTQERRRERKKQGETERERERERERDGAR